MRIGVIMNKDIVDLKSRWGVITGIVGMVANIFLSISKILLGSIFFSIAMVADGINNLADTATSIVLLVGFRLSSKPADKEHPFGHARSEYIAGLIVSFLIFFAGASLLLESVKKIFVNSPVEFSSLAIFVMIFSVVVKLFLGIFNLRISKKVNSKTIEALAVDSFCDIFASLGVILSMVLSLFFTYNFDGIMGAIVSVLIIISGVRVLKDMLSPLLGEKISKEKREEIIEKIKSYPAVLGLHDLMVHSYGGENTYASCHVEMDASINPLESHDIIDSIEREFSYENIKMILHYDPIEMDNERVNDMKNMVEKYILEIDSRFHIHDFRAVFGTMHTNLIFDLVVPYEMVLKDDEIVGILNEKIANEKEKIYLVVDIDKEF